MILRTHNLSKHFGGVVALDDVSVEFHPGSVTALVGSNGAGKSTLFSAMTGLLVPDRGEVELGDDRGGIRLTGLPPHVVARHGVGILFQDARVFGKLTALENVAVGAPSQPGERPLRSLFRRAGAAARDREVMELARQHLAFVGLAGKGHVWAEHLSYGEQKLVAIARLLAADARVLLLDEPTSGVHADRAGALSELVRQLADDHDRTVVMIEHNYDVVARVSDRVYRMDAGRVTASGSPREVLNSGRQGGACRVAQFGSTT
ncbi:MAG TPA: ATP-binding cassette domain-containing protein [Tepidisphaeraceae bacterium]|nr:ATP-binding cassette domain-containing protein [Tepidisphaeraceae bacterium]